MVVGTQVLVLTLSFQRLGLDLQCLGNCLDCVSFDKNPYYKGLSLMVWVSDVLCIGADVGGGGI